MRRPQFRPQTRLARSRQRQIAPTPPALTLAHRKRALEDARRGLETVRNGIKTAAGELQAIEASGDVTREEALLLNAALAFLIAQERFYAKQFERAEAAISALDPGGTTPIAGATLAPNRR